MSGHAPDPAAGKPALRRAALARREAAHAARGPDPAAHLAALLARHPGQPVAGYLPIGSEIDPLPAMAAAAARGPVAVPVIRGPGLPLDFARWTPQARLVPGPYGTRRPEAAEPLAPRLVIVPLVAFDRRGGRLGYGGGYYDRTLAALRAKGPVLAVGFAYAAQEAPALPQEPTDQPLDLIVTEAGEIRP